MDDASYIGLTCVLARHFIDVVWENLGVEHPKSQVRENASPFGHQFRFFFVVWLVLVDCISRSPVAAAGISAMSTTWCQVNLDSDFPSVQTKRLPERAALWRRFYKKWRMSYWCLWLFVTSGGTCFWSRLLFVGPPLWPNGAPKAGGSWS